MLEAGNHDSPRAAEALEQLCRAYWYPIYAFIRHCGHGVKPARDLTQSFFACLLERQSLKTADPARGKFRSFLLGAVTHFLADERDRVRALKRGGDCLILSLEYAEQRYGQEPADDRTPEKLFEQQWALTLLAQALERLRSECAADGRAALFEKAEGLLSTDQADFSYRTAASELAMSEGALRTAVHRLRRRYGQILREQIARTVSSSPEIDEEIQHLFEVLGRENR